MPLLVERDPILLPIAGGSLDAAGAADPEDGDVASALSCAMTASARTSEMRAAAAPLPQASEKAVRARSAISTLLVSRGPRTVQAAANSGEE